MEWFRVYSDIRADVKLQRIARKTGLPELMVCGAWVHILAEANTSEPRGILRDYTAADLARSGNCDDATAEALFNAFKVAGMIERNRIRNWDKRQFSSDDSNARSRKHRSLQRCSNDNATLQQRDCNTPEQNRAEQNKSEQNKSEPLPGGDIQQSKPPSIYGRCRECGLPYTRDSAIKGICDNCGAKSR